MTPEQHYLESLVALLRETGALNDADIAKLASTLSAVPATGKDAETLRDMAHGLRVGLVERAAPPGTGSVLRLVDGGRP